MDESWLQYYDLKTNCYVINENLLVLYPPIKFKVTSTARKVIMSVLWDAENVPCVDYFQGVATTTDSCYADSITKLRNAIEEKRLHSSPPHGTWVATAAIRK